MHELLRQEWVMEVTETDAQQLSLVLVTGCHWTRVERKMGKSKREGNGTV